MPAPAPLRLIIRLLSDLPDFEVVQDPQCWEIIKTHAGRYGVAPLVAFAARQRVAVPERRWCDRVLTRSWQRHSENMVNLEFILAAFEREGIRPMALKGPCLALRHYQPPFLRKPSIDLDFAVAAADFAKSCEVLQRAGYTPDTPTEEALEFSHHAVFMHPVRPRVEIHFRLTHGARGILVDEFLDRAVTYRLPGGREVLIPSPSDEILQLALHVASSRFAPFFHLYELRRVCASADPGDLADTVRRAEKGHFSGAIWMIDAAFRSLWGEPFLPPEAMPPRPWLYWRLNEKLYCAFENWSNLGGEHTLASRLRGRWLDLQTSDRPSDALRQLSSMVRFARLQVLKKGWRNLPVGGVRPSQ